MHDWLPAIFALIVAAAGWFYMFYSRAASKLSGIESDQTNRLRVRLRRTNGFMMVLLAAAFYVGYIALVREHIRAAAGYMFAVILLMGAVIVLALIDLRLTKKLRQSQRK